jgi:hypothetical protein
MNRIWIIALSLVISTTAQAQPDYERCDAVARLAEEVARSYQAGVSLSRVLELSPPEEAYRDLVVLIYSSSTRYFTPKMQEREIAEWRNRFHVDCLRRVRVE